MKKISFFAKYLGLIAISQSLSAQTAVLVDPLPSRGRILMSELQNPDGSDGNVMNQTVREFSASMSPGETWIPLGLFQYGTIHRLEISTSGHSANSSAVCEFSSNWNGVAYAHRWDQYSWQSRFQIYTYKHGARNGIAVKYLTSTANGIKIKHTSRQGAWLDHEPTLDFLNNLTDNDILKANIKNFSGASYPADGLERGIHFGQKAFLNGGAEINGSPVMTRASGAGTSASSTGFAGGTSAIASGSDSIAYGKASKATGNYSSAFGGGSVASGDFAFAAQTGRATNYASTALGALTEASGRYSFAGGVHTKAMGKSSTALGELTSANGNYSLAAGYHTRAYGRGSIAMGDGSIAGNYADGVDTHSSSIAMGRSAIASNRYAIALGYYPDATAHYSIAMGNHAQATKNHAVSIGNGTKATGEKSVALGDVNEAIGVSSTAMGHLSHATGHTSLAAGHAVTASGYFSSAFGVGTIAQDRAQTVVGQYNAPIGNTPPGDEASEGVNNADVLFVVGNGTGNAGYIPRLNNLGGTRSNALEVRQNGSTTMNGKAIINGGADIKGAITIEPQGDISMGIFGPAGN